MVLPTHHRIALWNALIPKSWRYVREDGNSLVFLHPRKGFRWVLKKRLGI